MIVAVEVRLGDEDRAKYGGPEWLTLDWSIYDDWDADRLMELEAQMGGLSINTVKRLLHGENALGIKGMAWLARQQAGGELAAPSWTAFKMMPQKVDTRRVGDRLPPADGSSGSAPGESTPESEPSSTTSPESEPSETSSES